MARLYYIIYTHELQLIPYIFILIYSLYSYTQCPYSTQLGEDYLALLPECLPFISELLEDNNDDVVASTSELVRVIEGLSGEKLDDYLS